MNKKLLAALVIILIILSTGYFLYLKGAFMVSKKKDNQSVVLNNEDYKKAILLMQQKDYDGAETLFISMENNVSTNNLGFLKLKELQIALLKKDYSETASDLNLLLGNPQFPKAVKSRAMENVFTSFLESGRDSSFYEAIFSVPQLALLKADTVTQSLYNYAEYGYSLSPTTILGANAIYNRLEKLKNISDSAAHAAATEDLKTFITTFFEYSDQEIETLSALTNQESLLINIHTERTRLLRKLSRQKELTFETNHTMQSELEAALEIANKLSDPFYTFYTSYNYIDYLTANKLAPRSDLVSVIGNQEIFNVEDISEERFHIVIKEPQAITKERLTAMTKINPALTTLIETYNKK